MSPSNKTSPGSPILSGDWTDVAIPSSSTPKTVAPLTPITPSREKSFSTATPTTDAEPEYVRRWLQGWFVSHGFEESMDEYKDILAKLPWTGKSVFELSKDELESQLGIIGLKGELAGLVVKDIVDARVLFKQVQLAQKCIEVLQKGLELFPLLCVLLLFFIIEINFPFTYLGVGGLVLLSKVTLFVTIMMGVFVIGTVFSNQKFQGQVKPITVPDWEAMTRVAEYKALKDAEDAQAAKQSEDAKPIKDSVVIPDSKPIEPLGLGWCFVASMLVMVYASSMNAFLDMILPIPGAF